MIARILITPCDHLICYSCCLPYLSINEKWCPICETLNVTYKRIPDKQKLYECDYPDCFKFFESLDVLFKHKMINHNLQNYYIPPTNMNQSGTSSVSNPQSSNQNIGGANTNLTHSAISHGGSHSSHDNKDYRHHDRHHSGGHRDHHNRDHHNRDHNRDHIGSHVSNPNQGGISIHHNPNSNNLISGGSVGMGVNNMNNQNPMINNNNMNSTNSMMNNNPNTPTNIQNINFNNIPNNVNPQFQPPQRQQSDNSLIQNYEQNNQTINSNNNTNNNTNSNTIPIIPNIQNMHDINDNTSNNVNISQSIEGSENKIETNNTD